ncbi:hypothetical protein Btru_045501 [Bulinus truncatus]|nr:hypothetical protein Btru_045501 [Bulinus truncatus]
MMNQMTSLIDDENIRDMDSLNEQIKTYEDLALSTLNNTYQNHSVDKMFNLLTYKAEDWNNYSCVMLAMKNNLGLFLSQIPCKILNKKIWRNGYIKEENSKNDSTSKKRKLFVRKALSPSILTLFEGLSHGVFLIQCGWCLFLR